MPADAKLDGLHADDLAFARACAGGDEAAWERFVLTYRPILYRAADALDPGGGARDLADSIYGELFERSLFRYFHGRSSLATWLRAVLSQRYIDRLRAGRRTEPLPDEEVPDATRTADADEFDPGRAHRIASLRRALSRAVEQLESRDRLRLACYYAQDLTLAQTGKLLGEHEATCSRQLARTRKTLRHHVEEQLRAEGLDDRTIRESAAAIAEDSGTLDLKQLLCKEFPVDRSR